MIEMGVCCFLCDKYLSHLLEFCYILYICILLKLCNCSDCYHVSQGVSSTSHVGLCLSAGIFGCPGLNHICVSVVIWKCERIWGSVFVDRWYLLCCCIGFIIKTLSSISWHCICQMLCACDNQILQPYCKFSSCIKMLFWMVPPHQIFIDTELQE